jgi:hypothetical protein
MQTRAAVAGIAFALIGSAALRAQQTSVRVDSNTPSLRSFESEAELDSYLMRIASLAFDAKVREDSGWGALCGSEFKITRRSKNTGPTLPPGDLVIRASVRDTAGQVVSNALLDVDGLWVQATTRDNGEAVLVIPPEKVPTSHRLAVTVRGPSHKFRRGHLEAAPGDTIDIAISLCESHIVLQQNVSVAGGSSGRRNGPTSDEQQGVDSGDDSRVLGRFLVILRRGRLFSFDLGSREPQKRSLRLIGFMNLYAAPGTSRFRPYYKLMVRGKQLVVIGYDNAERGVDVHLLRISDDGVVSRTAIYKLRVDCEYVRCHARLADGKLALFSTSPLTANNADSTSNLSAVKRVFPDSNPEEFHSLVTLRHIYRFPNDSSIGSAPFLNTITICDVTTPSLSCQAQVIIGPRDDDHYISPTALYVWTHEGDHPDVLRADDGVLTLFRVPLSGREPQALRLGGGPFDELSLNEEPAGALRVFATGDSHYGPRALPNGKTREVAALFTLHSSDFGNGTREAPASAHRALPLDQGVGVASEFVGRWLFYTIGDGSYYRTLTTVSTLFAVRTDSGEARRIKLPYYIERIAGVGSDALVVGTAAPDTLHFLRINPASTSSLSGHFALTHPSKGERESDDFSYDVTGSDRGLLAVPGSGYADSDSTHWVDGSTHVVFVRAASSSFAKIGTLSITAAVPESDSLEVQSGWAEDWYGNARGIFVGDRIFALIGYELIEAQVSNGRIVELRRINFMPRGDQSGWH